MTWSRHGTAGPSLPLEGVETVQEDKTSRSQPELEQRFVFPFFSPGRMPSLQAKDEDHRRQTQAGIPKAKI